MKHMKILINNYIIFNKGVRLNILSSTDLKAIKYNIIAQNRDFKKMLLDRDMYSKIMPLSLFVWRSSSEGYDYWLSKNNRLRAVIKNYIK